MRDRETYLAFFGVKNSEIQDLFTGEFGQRSAIYLILNEKLGSDPDQVKMI
jgi:hypothetical protein